MGIRTATRHALRTVTAVLVGGVITALIVSACASTPGPEPAAVSPAATAETSETTTAGSAAMRGEAAMSTVDRDRRARCIDAARTLDRRVEDEDVEFPEDPDEPSDEELASMLVPAVGVADDVLAPDIRPVIEPMPRFDIDTGPILELDAFVGSCFDLGTITDADVWGDHGEAIRCEAQMDCDLDGRLPDS